MAEQDVLSLPELYEEDETAWLETMSRLIAERRHREIDHKNLSEYLADMARRDKRDVLSRLAVLLAHLLTGEQQPERQNNSWRATSAVQRQELRGLLESGTLRNYAEEVLARAFARARRQAALETELPEAVFATDCPFDLEGILGSD